MGELKALSTWNLWGVPFVSPNVLSRMLDARRFFDAQMVRMGADRSGLVVACFQEAWSYRVGPLLKVVNKLSEIENAENSRLRVHPPESRHGSIANNTLVSFIVQVAMIILGWLMPWFHRWDQKDQLVVAEDSFALPHAIGLDAMSTAHWSRFTVVDSGLLILASQKPANYGFEPFPRTSVRGEEYLNNKGLLWAFWTGDKASTLVVNTHLTAQEYEYESRYEHREGGNVQLHFLHKFLKTLETRFSGLAPRLDMFVVGDFNYDIANPDFVNFQKDTKLRRIGSRQPSFRDGGIIDHVLTSSPTAHDTVNATPLHTPLSDHCLVVLPKICHDKCVPS
eukprot:Plantae.Rhodophyta-Purpureofilum_apyrenoidigerum.ctg15349.p1 GENE.Plantae.Rhodophyta-Purpureofilum_apyrenoidigerum.ctg15349~~Plantae.Rhodophyta-Purpureofilum_apyrenoidigerum.ctg15349.p1  ORF type:complete len:337 (-),score=41.30 Plantae.Rhodophyta-Purpureofilum_apyrenoidigerum.ctg15349:37-1047(-)